MKAKHVKNTLKLNENDVSKMFKMYYNITKEKIKKKILSASVNIFEI